MERGYTVKLQELEEQLKTLEYINQDRPISDFSFLVATGDRSFEECLLTVLSKCIDKRSGVNLISKVFEVFSSQ
jgi:hypothetical protein